MDREHPIVIDTGASCSVTPTLSDYVQNPTTPDTTKMEGLNGHTTEVVGVGPISWDIEDSNGIRDSLNTTAYYVPSANIRLFSPQVYIAEQATHGNRNCKLVLDVDGIALTLGNGNILNFPIQQGNNLPFMLTHKALHPGKQTKLARHQRTLNRFNNLASFVCSSTFSTFATRMIFNLNTTPSVVPSKAQDSQAVLSRSNWNISEAQQELLLWHNRLGHIGLSHVQSLLAKPRDSTKRRIIQPSNHKSSHCQICLCEACQYAKQKRRNPRSTTTRPRPENEGALSRNILIPGQRVSVDLYQSSEKGRLPYSFGKEKDIHKYTGGAIFVDHATRVVQHTHQFSTTASETVNSKHRFEEFCDSFGVKVQEYIGDNNPFHSKEWNDDCTNQQQTCALSGVGAHHQNQAERYVQTIFNMSRALLLHFAIHWPQAAEANLWPFAVDHAVYIWNQLPDMENKLSPLEHFTGTTVHDHHHLQRLHVFGCPVYVLDPKLQDGKKLPKWKRRSRRGVYLGVSKVHSSTVHLVLNPETGKVTPQYHVVFDDTFATVFSDGAFSENVWNSLLISNIERHPDIDDAADIVPFIDDRKETETQVDSDLITPKSTQVDFRIPTSTVSNPDHSQTSSITMDTLTSAAEGVSSASTPEGVVDELTSESTTESSSTPRRSDRLRTQLPPRRSQRSKQPVSRLTFSPEGDQIISSHFVKPVGSKQVHYAPNVKMPRVPGERLNQQYLANLKWNRLLGLCGTLTGTIGSFASELQRSTSYDQLVEYLNPAAFITLANKEDNPTFQEAMTGPDAAGFISAMEVEITTLSQLRVYDLVPRPMQKVISGVWAFKRKRYPHGAIRKLKARYCARGFEQKQGIDYFETFAPVVMWVTVRLLLIMSIIMDLDTKQIDYTAAFVHAPIDCVVYVECPKGFEVKGMVWKLNKSLYGLAQSPRNFFLHTKAQLTERLGFVQSEADPCLFISRDVICLIYVDDALLFYKNKAAVERLTTLMTKEKIHFREEEDVAGFLGVHIKHESDGSIHLTQRGLAERIVSALHLDDSSIKPCDTPATGYLAIDVDGEPPHETFSYASVVGQLNYLSGHSRCDITMATSQVARYIHRPRRSHELALIRIGRYLKGTLDKGIILRPKLTDELQTNLYVDAAFACGWGTEVGTNPDSVKSRTGYIIEIANCPVLWVSKLQTTVATSTMEAEYTALSMALRAYIPLEAVVRSVLSGLDYKNEKRATIKATVHEDNQGALILANLEPGRHTPRSKFYSIRLHWFRYWTQSNHITIQFVDTRHQKADFLTKALSSEPFQFNRRLSMGW